MSVDSRLEQSLEQQALLLATLIARFEQREERMRASTDQIEVRLRDGLQQAHRRIEELVALAGERIGRDAEHVLAAVVARHATGLADPIQVLRGTARVARTACVALAAILGITALLGWGALSHYRGEIEGLRGDLQRHQQAEAILRAYAASDIRLCGQALCVNVDPVDARGDGRYRVVRTRPAEQATRPE